MTVLATLFLFLGTTTALTAPSAAAEEDCYPQGATTPKGYFNNGFNGYFLPCPNGDDTHIFWDDNADDDPTSLHLWDCTSNPDIDLFFYVSSGVDQGWHKVGTTKRFWCLNTDGGWKSWGRQTRVGWYAFHITDHRGTGPLAGWMHAGW